MFGKREKEQAALHSKVRAVFNSPEGREVLVYLMKEFRVLDSTFDSDPYIHAFNEGARSTIVRLMKTINTNPEQFNEIVKKQTEKEYEI